MTKRKAESELDWEFEQKKRQRLELEHKIRICDPQQNPEWAAPTNALQQQCPSEYEWFVTEDDEGCCRMGADLRNVEFVKSIAEHLPAGIQREMFEYASHPCELLTNETRLCSSQRL